MLTLLRENRVNILNHSPISPYLNPIEHVWDMFERQLRRQYLRVQTLEQLRKALHQVWHQIPQIAIR
ncbi:hypothetical protein ALC56_05606 [Trachymyrmex septentrionalis]|uniref:Tc1-like transposase DDE domain-containing protein n=1 Tax=Trachymyrmex septentrionalis TaxID=34720 RepID=A0A151JXH7_9HYME|nr:hypothetical protein ALC56_05606 [Trachymyrmex septentrionalis]